MACFNSASVIICYCVERAVHWSDMECTDIKQFCESCQRSTSRMFPCYVFNPQLIQTYVTHRGVNIANYNLPVQSCREHVHDTTVPSHHIIM
jgi:hypothetical protein